jgi:CheY-like chemotaxis protein
MKITGAIAMGFALAHHPRLAHLDLDNCCLSQVAQCHISAGMISNRWVPMQIVNGFKVGPPLAAIGALDIIAQHLGNIECLSIRRNMQMKANLQWMEAQKASMAAGAKMGNLDHQDISSDVPSSDAINGPPSQSAYLRMLDWLSRIPFDEDELDNLRRYFYDIDDESPDGLRGSDGRLNLKVRGDLLAALGSNLEKEMLENEQNIIFPDGPSIGMCLWPEDANSDDEDSDMGQFESYEVLWNSSALVNSLESRKRTKIEDVKQPSSNIHEPPGQSYHEEPGMTRSESSWRRDRGSIARIESQMSTATASSQGGKNSKSLKARISMFPQFLDKLDLLKGNAQDMMDAESDSTQQDIIAQQFAEASLILLRQLRYHCMNSGLDGWRQGKSRRKILIVDDSMVTRKLVARAFEKANFIVDTAQNGEEGVAMMKKSIYDIAFMDIDMPVMNGFDATKALREWENLSRPGARQPICALTAAYVDDFEISELMKFKEAGLDVMESKPCNIPRLFKVVDDVSPMFSDLSISVTQHL